MQITNEVFPSDPAQVTKLLEKGPDGPVFMVNLLKLKDKAAYEDGRETKLSGRAAYTIYGRAVADVTFLSLGQVEELWDEVAIAMYPKRADMLRMSMSDEWR